MELKLKSHVFLNTLEKYGFVETKKEHQKF